MINFKMFIEGFIEGFCSGFKLITYKSFFQHIFRGWDDSETKNLDLSLYKWLLPRLKRFKEISDNYPDSKYDTFEEWDNELDKRLKQLEYIVKIYPDTTDIKLNRIVNDFNKWLFKDLCDLWW